MISVIYVECHKPTNCAGCCYAECHYAECRYAKCRYAECRGAISHAGYLKACSKLKDSDWLLPLIMSLRFLKMK
jgi:hypothetical protein